MVPYPVIVRPDQQPPAPECICRRESKFAHFCEVCQEYSDCCLACLPEPPCECVYVREDVTDAADCQLHDPDSHYNDLLRAAERRKAAAAARKPAGHAHVHPVFAGILNTIRRAS